ncbi:MAG: integrase family protein [Vicinamibacteria bacterium]
MARRLFKLTKETVDAALKDSTPRIVWDEEIRGLGLRIRSSADRPTGRFLFAYRPKSRGQGAAADRRMRWMTFGEYGRPYTADEARKWGKNQRALLDGGQDPAAIPATPAQPEDSIPTLAGYAGPVEDSSVADRDSCRYLHLKALRTKPDPPKASSVKVDRGNLTRICAQHPIIAAKRLHLITPEDIKLMVNRDEHRSAGNRWLAVLRHLFNVAAVDGGAVCDACSGDRWPCVGVVDGGFKLKGARVGQRPDKSTVTWQNPCEGISRYTEKGREPEITDEHLGRLLDVLDRHLTPSTPEELAAQRRGIQPVEYRHKDGSVRVRAQGEAGPTADVVFEHDPYIAGLVKMLLLTGARSSEIRTARWPWVAVTEARGESGPVRSGVLRLPDSKEGGGKTIFLAPDAVAVLDRLPRRRGSDYLFPGRTDGCIEQTSAVHWWARHRAEAGLDEIPLGDGRTGPATLHDLRHNYAAVLIGEGMSLGEVGELLGHKSETTTKRYASLAVRLKAERAATAASVITSKAKKATA